MAEKTERKPEPATASAEKKDAAKPAAGGAAGILTKTPVLVGSVMIIEAIVLFAGFKLMGGGGPSAAEGATLVDPHADTSAEGGHGAAPGTAGHAKGNRAEVQVLQFKAPNKLSGRTFVYDVAIFVVTPADKQAEVSETIKANEALIQDRVRTIIAQSDPEKLGGGTEPGLETLRRQVKYQLDEIIGEGMVSEVLVPKCIPIRTDY
jgi:flagellar basal body-associated protein FliL